MSKPTTAAAKHSLRDYLAGLFALLLLAFGPARRNKKIAFEGSHITAIYFHNPPRRLFEGCVRWLKKNGYTFLDEEQLIAIFHNGAPVPKGAVWISFDDGWRGTIEHVIPVVRQYNVPVTLFVPTYFVENGGRYWWQYVRENRDKLPAPYNQDVNQLWKIAESERQAIVMPLMEALRTDAETDRQAISRAELEEIAALPQVTIGGHTMTHPMLLNCTEEELRQELAGCKEILQEWCGEDIKSFAYPSGAYDGREGAFLKNQGFKIAATAEHRFVSVAEDDPFYLPRLSIYDSITMPEAIAKMLNVWQPVVGRVKKLRS